MLQEIHACDKPEYISFFSSEKFDKIETIQRKYTSFNFEPILFTSESL